MYSDPDKGGLREDVVPIITSRANHPISRNAIDEEALKVLYRLHHHGFLAYLVGGSVRDLLLGRTPKDFDVATNAHPHEINALFRNSRIIGRRFRLVQVYFRGRKVIEVSTFRSRSEFEEVQGEDGTMIRTDSFGTPGEDAFRRDLTINGLFYNIADFSIIDYVGGMEDLKQGIVRTIGDSSERFKQDPVRMIRVIRHAARTGFHIDKPTYRALLQNREELQRCPPSRVRDEFLRELKESVAGPSLRLMLETGLLFTIFPEFQRVFGDRNPKKGRDQAFFLNLFGLVDELGRIGKPVSERILLALLAIPLLRAVTPEHPYLGEKERFTYWAQTVRLVLHQLLLPFSFPRGTREMAAQLLTAQSSIERSVRHGVVHKRLRTKKYFQEAVLLFGIEAQARGARVPHFLRRAVPPDFLPWWPKEFNKKRHRR